MSSKKDQLAGKLGGRTESPSMGNIAGKIFGLHADENEFDAPIVKIELAKIIPDMAQPRRATPKKARGKNYNGSPESIKGVLVRWQELAEEAIGESINVVSLIEKYVDGQEIDESTPYIARLFFDLVALAGSIYRDGLNSPISVVGRVAPHTIVTGERRFWAYHLLHHFFGEKWSSIRAVILDGKIDPWLQGAENAARLELTAIDKARQIAVLLMDMYEGDKDVEFNDITYFDHELDYYAQVKRYKIKDGYGERVKNATGLKSTAQISQYRALLRLSREHWDAADEDNWTEGYARQFIPRDEGRLTTVNLDTPKKSERDLFIEGIGAVLRHKIQRNTDALGLYAVGAVAMFVWWNQSRGGWEVITLKDGASGSRIVYDMPGLVGSMYDHAGAIGAWEEMTKHAFDLISKPSLPKTFAPMVAQGDDRGVFVEKMLAWLEKSVKGSSSKIGVMARTKDKWLFVNWEGAKYSYDERRFEGRSFKGGATGAIDDIEKFVGRMYDTLPYLDRWQMMTEDEFWAMMHPPKKSPTPQLYDAEKARADIMGDDDDLMMDEDGDVPIIRNHPFGDGEIDEEALALHEQAMIDADVARYKAKNPPTSQPPQDFDNPPVFGEDTPEYALAWAVMKVMEREGNQQAQHVATMLQKVTGHEIANWHTNWSDVVARWHEIFTIAVADIVNAMFNKLDGMGKP